MYAENEPIFPYFQSLPQELQQLEEFCCSQKPNPSMASAISEYDIFNAPDPFLEEPLLDLDPMTAAISMISCADDVMSQELNKFSDIETEQFFNDALYGYKEDLLSKEPIEEETPFSEALDIGIPIASNDEKLRGDEHLSSQGLFRKCGSSESLSSMEWIPPLMPNFLNFPARMDFGGVYGMRRSFSEGDIKIISSSISEARKEKLSRYRSKRNKRNFGRKIKYACRKALADSQPRIRGRFAKTEETSDGSKKQ